MEQEQESPPAAEPRHRGTDRKRRWVLITGVVVVAGAGISAAAWVMTDDGGKAPSASATQVTTATVKRQALEKHAEVDGKLGFSGSYDIINQAKGVMTSLPSVGKEIDAGDVLYRVDGKPVIFLRGDKSPAYRALSNGSKGNDVKQLNAALVDLGYSRSYGPSATSNYFGSATEDAVERLQDDLNVEETGKLDLGSVVFLPTDNLRITERTAVYGAAAPTGQSVFKATSTTPRVRIAMDASQVTGIREGDKVSVLLPTGKDTPGRVSNVGRVATTNDKGSTIPVDVRLSDPKAARGLDAASVKVTITSDRVDNVLAVPVTALLAMAGGGYSVEVVDANNARRLVRVQIGMFDGAAGMVEVKGAGLAEGQRVVVPAS